MTDEQGTRDSVGERVETTGDTNPFIDDVFSVLADWRRREVCQFFAETDAETATVDDLALLLSGCRPDPGTGTRSHSDIVAELEETHLPELAAAGIVDFDARSGTVRYRGQPTVEKWVEHVAAVNRRQD